MTDTNLCVRGGPNCPCQWTAVDKCHCERVRQPLKEPTYFLSEVQLPNCEKEPSLKDTGKTDGV